MMFSETKVTSGRVIGMAETRSTEEVAEILGIDEEEVCRLLEEAGKPVKSGGIVTCNKTGRFWNVRSPRGAYRLAQLQGLVDWDFAPA